MYSKKDPNTDHCVSIGHVMLEVSYGWHEVRDAVIKNICKRFLSQLSETQDYTNDLHSG